MVFERFTKPSALESAQKAANSLMSERGEANARGAPGSTVGQATLTLPIYSALQEYSHD